MTEQQLLDKYKDPDVAAAIMANLKPDASLWRPHPEAPECAKAIQYWALEKENKSELHTKSEEASGSMSFDVDNLGAASIMPLIAQAMSMQSSSSSLASLAPTVNPALPGQEPEETDVARKIREAAEKAARLEADKKRNYWEAKAEKQRQKDDARLRN